MKALLPFSLMTLLAATPVKAADPHDIIGGLIGLGIVASVLDDNNDVDVNVNYDDGPRYRERRHHHRDYHERGPRIGPRDAQRLCERALYRHRPHVSLRDIDDFDYHRRHGSYSMILQARKHGRGHHGHHGQWRSYRCTVDARSGYVDLDRD